MEFSKICPNYDHSNYDCKEEVCEDCSLYYNFHPESEHKRELNLETLEKALIGSEREKFERLELESWE